MTPIKGLVSMASIVEQATADQAAAFRSWARDLTIAMQTGSWERVAAVREDMLRVAYALEPQRPNEARRKDDE